MLLSKPLNLPSLSEVPPVFLNPVTSIFISQASSEAASGWSPVYRGLFSTQMEDEDLYLLEHELPDWVAEFLLANKVNGVAGGAGVPSQKFSFMVVPWKGDDEGDEYLPDLLSSQSRLTASKFLRVRKVLGYVSKLSSDQSSSLIASRSVWLNPFYFRTG
jgi:WD repeat-containing protein 48